MTLPHVFAETNFLFAIFGMPSKRRPNALALQSRFDAGEIKLHVPYLCFQEARYLISKTLRSNRGADLLEFHGFAKSKGIAYWDFAEVKKLLDAANGEANRTKAVYQSELSNFARALADGILHGNKEVFDFLESLDLDDDNLKYNDKLILSSVLVKAKQLHEAGEQRLYFVSLDKSDLQPTDNRPKMKRYYDDIGLKFVSDFELQDMHSA